LRRERGSTQKMDESPGEGGGYEVNYEVNYEMGETGK
jgi:hypothetical protein